MTASKKLKNNENSKKIRELFQNELGTKTHLLEIFFQKTNCDKILLFPTLCNKCQEFYGIKAIVVVTSERSHNFSEGRPLV
jgi:hypothetical protein